MFRTKSQDGIFTCTPVRRLGGKMIRIYIPFFYRLGVSLDAIRNIQGGANLAEAWSNLYSAQQDLDTMLSATWFAPAVRAAFGPGTRLIETLKALTENTDFSKPRTVTPLEAYKLGQTLNEFEAVLRNELQNAETYFVTRKAAYDTSVLISNAELVFSQELPAKVTPAIPDVREAGKCLAFELSTAAGFHVMRAVESVVRAYWDAVAHGTPHPRQKNLGAYLKQMELKDIGAAKVRAALQQLKDLHRNPVMHPEENLSLDEAIGLFGIAQSVVKAMLKEIPVPTPRPVAAMPAPASP